MQSLHCALAQWEVLLHHEVPVLDGHLNLFVWFGLLTKNMCHPITGTSRIKGMNSQGFTDKAEIILSVLEVKSQQQDSKILQCSFHDNKQLFPSRPKNICQKPKWGNVKIRSVNYIRLERQSGLVRRPMNSTAKGNSILLPIFCVFISIFKNFSDLL